MFSVLGFWLWTTGAAPAAPTTVLQLTTLYHQHPTLP